MAIASLATLIETLTSYVPTLITRRSAAKPTLITQPIAEHFDAAVLFVDISGFTPLTERLAQRGAAGVEELSRLLNAYFGQLVDLIHAHGGDVVKFAGDALLAVWPVSDPAGLSEAALRAAQCGLAAQAALRVYAVAAKDPLRSRVAVGTGQMAAMHVGGTYHRWEFVLAGEPLVQVGRVEKQGRPGEVILSSEVWQLIGNRCTGEVLPTSAVHLLAVREPLSLQSLDRAPPSAEAEAALWAYVPGAIRARLAAGQSGWLAEFRCLTVLFVNLPELDYTTPLDRTQQIMQTLQAALYRYEGSVNKINVDEKGVTLVAALGLPPLAHENDAARGVQAALAMQAALDELGVRSAVGVTTGQIFCGSVGSETRREYTLTGDIVNLSARLMQGALHHKATALLCDEATYQAAQAHIAFEALPPIQVKGKAEPVPVYRPLGERRTIPQARAELVGRTAERMLLADRIQGLLGGIGGVVIIEGEAGIGKSCLVEDLLRQAHAFSLISLPGAGDAIEKSTPYHAWRPVFARLFNLDLLNDPPERQRAHVLAQLEETYPDLMRLAPLLNAVLPLDLPDNEFTAQLVGEGRANNTYELLAALLQAQAQSGALVLILEDAHWLDSASWALSRLVRRDVQPALLVLVTRPLGEPPPVEYTRLRDAPDTQHLLLDVLPPDEIERLICQRLGVTSLPGPVACLIREKAEGHPFFSEELAYALRDAGLIHIANGKCQIDPGADDLHTLDFPDTIQGVITSRIDRLAPQRQLTLKVASVIGRVFAFRVLRDVHPIEADKPHLANYLDALERLDITPLETPEPDLAYIFKHIITQEVTYNLMAFAQRRQLHRAVAEWYERTYADDLAPFYPLLARHWTQAAGDERAARGLRAEPGLMSKAIDYLEKAGEQALNNGAYREAVDFFSQAMSLDTHLEPGSDRLRRAHWERRLGDAYYGLGNPVESRVHLQQAVASLGWSVPATRGKLIAGILGQLLRQCLHRLWPTRFVGHAAEARSALLEAACAYETLGRIHYHAVELAPGIYSTLRILNLAERAGPSPRLARAYGGMALAAGAIPLHFLARAYSARARETVSNMPDLSALAWLLLTTGAYSLGVGQWADARDAIEQAVAISDRLGNRRDWGDSLSALGFLRYFQGEFAHSAELWLDVYRRARDSDNIEQQGWALNGRAMCLLRLGQIDEAVTMLEMSSRLLDMVAESRIGETINAGVLAMARLRQGQMHLARQAAEVGGRLIAQLPLTSFTPLEGYAGVAEAYLALWEASQGRPPAERKALAKSARQACKALRGYARVFPIGQPRAWLYRGWYEWLAGRPRRAQRAWHKSLAEAERLAMPYDEGLAHYEIGWHLPVDNPNKQEHLVRACEIFDRLGATYDLGRAQEML